MTAAESVEESSLHDRRHWPSARWVLAFSMFVMGACGMIYEYALGILGNNLIGSSHEQIFVIIGLMMFAMGLGATFQQRFEGALIDRFLTIELLLGLLGGVSTLVIFTAFAYTGVYRLVLYAFAMSIGMLIGCEIPLLIRINSQYSVSLKANLSAILSMDYVGSLAGALLFVYGLLSRFSVERISLMLGCANALLALGGLFYFWPLVQRRGELLAATTAVLVVLLGCGAQSSGWMYHLEQRCFEDPIVLSHASKYQHLVLTRRADHLRLFIDGHLQFSSRDEFIYHEFLVHVPMSLAARHDRILILGGGDGLALREVLRYGDVDEVTLVDIDPAMIQLASSQPDLIELNQASFDDTRVRAVASAAVSPGEPIVVMGHTKRHPLLDRREYPLATVHAVTMDADLFLRQTDQQFDVVLIDFPDPRSIELAKLYSVPFYRQLAEKLSDGAVVSIQSTSPSEARRVFACIGATLDRAGWKRLPYHAHIPSFGDWGWNLVWSSDESTKQMRDRIAELRPISVATRHLTPKVIDAAFVFGKNVLLEPGEVLPNTRLRPVVVHYREQDFR